VSKQRYTYTPRRRNVQSRSSVPALAAIPVAVGIAIAAFWLASSGGGEDPSAPAEGRPSVEVLSSSGTPQPSEQAEDSEDAEDAQDSAPVASPAPTPVDPNAAPKISGFATVVMEEPCGAVLHKVNGDVRRPPASLTKIATALVADDNAAFDELVNIDVAGAEFSLETDSTIMGLEPGQQLTMQDLLYGLLLPSGNDAAIQIAEHISGSVPRFVQLMNLKVDELGLENTHFANPHGLDDDELYTSAYDMALLGRELLKRPRLAEIVGSRQYQPAWDGPAVGNLNQLLGFYPGTLGVKTGYTPLAGQTIVAAAEQGGRRIIVSILGDQFDIYYDVSELLNWAFQETEPACGPAGLGSVGGNLP
jgi:D-alanyl-D-alanine carboxypeptidase